MGVEVGLLRKIKGKERITISWRMRKKMILGEHSLVERAKTHLKEKRKPLGERSGLTPKSQKHHGVEARGGRSSIGADPESKLRSVLIRSGIKGRHRRRSPTNGKERLGASAREKRSFFGSGPSQRIRKKRKA